MMKAKLLLLLVCLCTVCAMGQEPLCRKCRKAVSKCVCNKKQPAPQPTRQPQPRKLTASYSNYVLRVGNVVYKMKRVDGGTFTMGATAEMSEPWDTEKPTHQVTLSRYSIGETEVTQALWQAVMGNNLTRFKGNNLPVENVSWDDCQTFINKLNNLTGQRFRLPTEAEWEFAARGGNRSNHTQYSGSSSLDEVAWYYDNSGSKTHPVKTKKANELGLYDMAGNVWEWCQDWYGIYSSSSQYNPAGPNSGSFRVNRGGSWLDAAGSAARRTVATTRLTTATATLGCASPSPSNNWSWRAFLLALQF